MNNDDLKKKWDKALETGEKVLVGDIVVCDICNEDYTKSEARGGMLFGSYAYCPSCMARDMPRVIANNEADRIIATCPPAMSFADFVRAARGPDSYIRVTVDRR